MEIGTEHEGLIHAVKQIGGHVFAKSGGTVDDLRYFLQKEKLPVIFSGAFEDGDHYSVAVERHR